MKFRKPGGLIVLTLIAIFLSSCNIGASPAPTEDPGAIQTQAFGVVLTQAADQQTQTAAGVSPTPLSTNTPPPTSTLAAIPTFPSIGGTNTPFAFNTQQPGLTPLGIATSTTVPGAVSTVTTKNGCNDGWLVSESPPYDGKTMKRNTEFTKSWEFLNTGTCVWDEGYTFVFVQEFSTAPLYVTPKDYTIPKAGPFTKPGEYRTFSVNLRAPKDPGEYTWYYKLRDDSGAFFGSLVWVTIISVAD